MSTLYDGHALGKLLADEGLLPDECAEVTLVLPVDGVLQLHFVKNVTQEDLPKIQRALAKLEAQG